MLKKVDGTIRELVDVGLSLIALAIVAGIIYGGDLPFLGTGVAKSLTDFIAALGSAGLVGLIAAGIILWLFQRK